MRSIREATESTEFHNGATEQTETRRENVVASGRERPRELRPGWSEYQDLTTSGSRRAKRGQVGPSARITST
jgi:hypothetical protein